MKENSDSSLFTFNAGAQENNVLSKSARVKYDEPSETTKHSNLSLDKDIEKTEQAALPLKGL